MSDDVLRKIPPSNVEAEEQLIASIIHDNDSLDKIQQFKVSSEDFYDERHKIIFRAFLELKKFNKPINIISLRETLKTSGGIDKAGGTEYLAVIMEKIPTSANAEFYSDIVKSKSMLRQLIYVSSEIITKSYSSPQDVKSLIDEAEKKIFDINQDIYSTSFALIKKVLNDTIAEIININRKQGELSGVPSGFTDLDDKTDGFQKQEMIIVAARPSMGKTAFGINVAVNSALKYGKKIGIFSCEMSRNSLVKRMLCSEAGINGMQLTRGMISKVDQDKLVRAGERLYDTTIVFDDTPNIPILELRSKARKMKKDYEVDLIIVDYLQLITVGDEISKNTPRHEMIGYISRSLKSLARSLDIPIIALAQLNRKVDDRGTDSTPRLSDLKDSGSIEQDADVILFIHRAEGQNPSDVKDTEIRDLIIGKNRNGPTDTVKLVFQRNITKFQNYTKDSVM